MAHSEQQKAILKLGELLVRELNLENSVDTLSRWMAHYIAEKISEAEALPRGAKKTKAEKECYALILDLWKHRWHYKPERQPLRDFNELYNILERLDPDKEDHYFFRWSTQSKEEENNSFTSAELNNLAAFAFQVDRVARIWIEYLLQTAVEKANSEKNKKLIELAAELKESPDVQIIQQVLIDSIDEVYVDSDEESIYRKTRIATLQRRINELQKFREFNEYLIGVYEKVMRET